MNVIDIDQKTYSALLELGWAADAVIRTASSSPPATELDRAVSLARLQTARRAFWDVFPNCEMPK